MDPVQDDEGHAADHHKEAQQQEGGGLVKETVSHLANVLDATIHSVFNIIR